MVSTKFCSVTASKLIELLQVLSSLHSWMELVLDQPIRDLGSAVNGIIAEGERRQLHVADSIDLRGLDRRRLRRIVRGALDMTVQAHGPITLDWTDSAAKRAVGFILRETPDE